MIKGDPQVKKKKKKIGGGGRVGGRASFPNIWKVRRFRIY